ncbi:uncharacterized protein LOC143556641 [Bidens hawaiensis]|uniref:uncharacterized protein LOC143556641 n=1 Tax=Bidens hawaiensis TaxID=980011 RepID=UPI004049C93D
MFENLMILFKKLENWYKLLIQRIISDNGSEFKNNNMMEYCNEHGILHEFNAPYTPQQNGVAERKNRSLIETARAMKFGKTCFELLNRRKPNLKWIEPFGSQCTSLDANGKFGSKSIVGFFGYAWLFNYDNLWKSVNLHEDDDLFDEAASLLFQRYLSDDFYQESTSTDDSLIFNEVIHDDPDLVAIPSTPSFDDNGETHDDMNESVATLGSDEVIGEENVSNLQDNVSVSAGIIPRTLSYHPEENIIRDIHTGVHTRSQVDQILQCFYTQVSTLQSRFLFKCFISQIEPKTYKEALTEESWVNAKKEELQQFRKLGVWKLVDLPDDN